MKSKLLRVVLLLTASSAVGIFYNFISPNRLVLFSKLNDKHDYNIHELENKIKSSNELIEITSEQAYELNNELNTVFIDARDQWEYSKKRIMNAINIPEYSFDNESTLLKNLNKNGYYIIYCSSEDCNLSTMLALKMKKIGFKKLFILKGGIETWISKNFPTEGV